MTSPFVSDRAKFAPIFGLESALERERTDVNCIEALLCALPLVRDAISFGTENTGNGVIISMASSAEKDGTAAKNGIWAYIESHINPTLKVGSRLSRSLVLFAQSDKPFVYSEDRIIERQKTLMRYEEEIMTAYRAFDNEKNIESEGQLATPKRDAIKAFLNKAVESAIGFEVASDDDFFEAGMDSLTGVKLRHLINSAMHSADAIFTLPKNAIYDYSSVDALSDVVLDLIQKGSDTAAGEGHEKLAIKQREQMEELIAYFSGHFPQHTSNPSHMFHGHGSHVLAVTGTTGSLGSTFLSEILSDSPFSKIYLLNRASPRLSSAARYQKAFHDRGLDFSQLEVAVSTGRVVCLQIDFRLDRLGLSEEAFEILSEEVTHIVHIAWTNHLRLGLPSYMSHIAAVRGLIDLALHSERASPPHFTFLSSLSVASLWSAVQPIPEGPVSTSSAVAPYGYAQAKYVSEKIIENAIHQCPDFSATIVRCRHLSGSLATGAWSEKDIIPLVLGVSARIKRAPEIPEIVHWLPVENAASSLKHITCKAEPGEQPGMNYFNLDNTHSLQWGKVINSLSRHIQCPVPTIPIKEWAERAGGLSDRFATDFAGVLERYSLVQDHATVDSTKTRGVVGDHVLHTFFSDDILELYIYSILDKPLAFSNQS